MGRTGSAGRSARAARAGLRLVHRGFRYRRSEGSAGAAEPAGVTWAIAHSLAERLEECHGPSGRRFARPSGTNIRNRIDLSSFECHTLGRYTGAKRTTATGGSRASGIIHESPPSSEIHNPPLVEPKASPSPLSSTARPGRH